MSSVNTFQCLHYKYTGHVKVVNTIIISFIVKMASAQTTPHYELYDDQKDIMIYGIKLEELHQDGFEITSNTITTLHQMIPDVMAKCANSSFAKKAVVVYMGGIMEIVQMRYFTHTHTHTHTHSIKFKQLHTLHIMELI